jgi:hypothetical protein
LSKPSEASDVSIFLVEVKRTIAKAGSGSYGWVLVNRRENWDCLANLGFTLRDVGSTLQELTVADYCEGPVKDLDMPGDLWVFGKELEGKEIYVKLKLARLGPLAIVRVVSFHFAEKPLSYPYK